MRSCWHSCLSPPTGHRDRRPFVILLTLLAAIGSATGCGGTKVLLPQSGTLIRSGPDVSGKVYMWDGSQWVLSANKVRIPEGWFIGPLDD
jgi:hypothetical protein